MPPIRSLILAAACLFAVALSRAQEIPLWPETADVGPADNRPSITVYSPAEGTATGAAMVIFPGGGYGGLARHEGEGFARWFAQQGVTAFVVKYRLGSKGHDNRHPAMLHDAARAVRFVRSRAAEWNIDRDRVGVIGSSAGGHLAATILTHFDAGRADDADPIERESSRPTLGILCYPVITMGEYTHGGSRKNLLGPEPSPELIEQLSAERQVTAETPPCFIWHTWEDKGVRVENALLFAQALREKGVRFELHVYEKGGHGMGLGDGGGKKPPHRWTADCLAWLGERGFLTQPAPDANAATASAVTP
jgi:acetyl esterase/lipase